jgi:subtilase family serine protease
MRIILLSLICSIVLSACVPQKILPSVDDSFENLQADLEVQAVEIGEIVDNRQSLEVVIRNNGNSTTVPSHILVQFDYASYFFRFSQAIPSIEKQSIQTISVLAPRGQRFHYLINSYTKSIGLQVHLDLTEQIEESDERNNLFVVNFGYDLIF